MSTCFLWGTLLLKQLTQELLFLNCSFDSHIVLKLPRDELVQRDYIWFVFLFLTCPTIFPYFRWQLGKIWPVMRVWKWKWLSFYINIPSPFYRVTELLYASLRNSSDGCVYCNLMKIYWKYTIGIWFTVLVLKTKMEFQWEWSFMAYLV